MNLSGRRIVLGVCGGVAAYKSVEVCRRLIDAGAFVSPVLTNSATRFIGPATFAALASEPPRTSLWDSPEPSPHTTLGQSADLIVVVPATARLIGSYANGLSDDLLATTLIATRAPVVVAPAMHTEMWEHPSVVDNMATLRARGVVVVEPESGHLAGGDQGVGRLASPESILTTIQQTLLLDESGDYRGKPPTELRGRRVLVTAGGTREAIDPVRFLGNRSSGKQGIAIAREAARMGAEVTLVSTVEAPGAIVVESAADMHAAVMHHLPDADVVVMAAAVADFRPVSPVDRKLKKADGAPQIILEPTVDILSEIADKRRADQIVVGFAAETDSLAENAADKLRRKRLDFIVANDVSQPNVGFGHDTNDVLILGSDGSTVNTGLLRKDDIATGVLRLVAQELRSRTAGKATH